MAKVLVVDDERMICELLQTALTRHGHDVLTATSGEQALDLFQVHRPSITLMDLWMPEKNGIQVLIELRAIDSTAQVIMLTAHGTDKLESQARELGVSDFLRKGLSLHVLLGAVEKLGTLQCPFPAVPSPHSASGVDNSEHASILVVDDEGHICELVRTFLSRRGYQVNTAHTGLQALEQIQRESPRLVLLDINMPGMNGVEVLRRMRLDHYAGEVIVMTACQDEQLLHEALNLGSIDIMGKPLDLERLLIAVEVGLIFTEP